MSFARTFFLALIFAILCNVGFSQNTTCGNAQPFCTGTPVSYPASTNAGSASGSTSWGCLGSQPNPAWFYLQMGSSGSVNITMSANADIDFIAWGPFPNLSGICSNLGAATQVPNGGGNNGCSYSASNTENFNLANAVAGQFYVLLITNFSNQNQTINFNQTNSSSPGAGTTNCGLVCGIMLNNSGFICPGGTAVLSAIAGTNIVSYSLLGPSGQVDGNPSLPPATTTQTFPTSVTLGNTTTFTMQASTSSGTCQVLSTVSVIPYPSFSISPANPSICQGNSSQLAVTFTVPANPSQFSYTWSSTALPGTFNTGGTGIVSQNAQSTLLFPGLISGSQATIIYTAEVSPNVLYCPRSQTVALNINNPLTPTLNLPGAQCNSFPSIQLTASPGGGTWTAPSNTNLISSTGLLQPNAVTSAFGTQTLFYSASVGTCIVSNSGTIAVSKYISPALTSSISTLCIQDPAVNLMSIVQNTQTGVWSGIGVSGSSGNYLFTPSNTPAGYGQVSFPLTYSTQSIPDPTVCPAFTILAVPVFNPPIPVINPIAPRCNNSGSVQLTANPTGSPLWTGNNAVSSTGVLNPNVISNGGTQTVFYSAGQGTCTATGSQTFHISIFHTAALTGTIPNLCVSNNPFNLMSIVQDNNGVWSGQHIIGTSSSAYAFDPGGLMPPNWSTYVLGYYNPSTPDTQLCPDSRTIAVSVSNPPSPNISPAGPFCSVDGTVQLSVNPNIGIWTASSYLTQQGMFTPSLSPLGTNNAVQYVIGTSTCNAQQTAFISVEAFVSSSITTSQLPDQCNTGIPLSLLPMTLNNSGVWSGPGVQGSSFNPAQAGVGSMVLTYNTASYPSHLCPDQHSVAVNVYSLALPSISGPNAVCNSGAPFQISVNPIGGVFGGANTHAVNPEGIFIPALSGIGKNIINYSITSGPCVAYAQTTINVEKFISADFNVPQVGPFCQGEHKSLNMNSVVQNPGGIWQGTGMNNNMFNADQANVSIPNIITYQTHSEPTATLCPDMKTIQVRVNPEPKIEINSSTEKGCAPLEIIFNAPNTNQGQLQWVLGDNSENQNQTGLNINHTYENPGTYHVSYIYTDAGTGCQSRGEVNNLIRVYEVPKADFYVPDEISIANPEVQLINQSNNVATNKFQWLLPGQEGDYSSNELNPEIYLPNPGDYRITLKATSLNGCKNELSKIITVKAELNIFIPDAFTPNYDGINDTFKPVFSPYGLDRNSYSMEIYDRWGKQLFQSKDPDAGWDGTVQNRGQEALKQDVYLFRLRVKNVEGILFQKTGTLQLIK